MLCGGLSTNYRRSLFSTKSDFDVERLVSALTTLPVPLRGQLPGICADSFPGFFIPMMSAGKGGQRFMKKETIMTITRLTKTAIASVFILNASFASAEIPVLGALGIGGDGLQS